MFKYLFFDLDGTLTDSEEGITKSLCYALKFFGIDNPDDKMLRKFIGPSLSYSFKNYCGFDEEKARQATLKYRERFESIGLYENKLYNGIEDMLAKLKSIGKNIVLATSKPYPYAIKILDYFDITKYFTLISGAEFEGSKLEKEDIIERAIVKLGFVGNRKDAIAMIGDRRYDIHGAKVTGVTSIGVKYGFSEENELEEEGADYIFNKVQDLCEFLIMN